MSIKDTRASLIKKLIERLEETDFRGYKHIIRQTVNEEIDELIFGEQK